ncbi:MAG TPA: peptidylprolyl isomerase [Candidatus Limnocylindrales bacterium]|jgi:cyclophilin family peptidyl-prolyl cis-trans isomerase|nr:peptidylprolyl isomerase [Candidatus Limnocylindrales bacterium]
MTLPPIQTAVRPFRFAATLTLAAVVAVGCNTAAGGPGVASAVPSTGPAAACPTAQPPALAAGQTRTVTLATTKGIIAIKVEADLSPIAAGNFVALADCGFYDGVVFHRVVPGFVIQGGDPTGTGSGGPGYTIKDEAVTAEYGRGVVAMARTSQPDSVGSQFFIVTDDAARDSLASYNTYQIIGHVTAGMDIADAITAAAGGEELPAKPETMTDVSVSNP